MINGNLDSNSYSNEAASDENIDVLRNITRTIEDKKYTEKYYDLNERAIPNKVTVKLKSGEIFEEEVLYPLGHKERREESKPFLREKFCKSIENKDFDIAKLISFYDENDLDSINIYDLLDKIYK